MKSASDTTSASGDDTEKKDSGNNIRLFSFPVMENVLKAARLLAPMYHGSNTLYKDEQEEMYLLALAGPITPPQISIGSAICCLNTVL